MGTCEGMVPFSLMVNPSLFWGLSTFTTFLGRTLRKFEGVLEAQVSRIGRGAKASYGDRGPFWQHG